MILKAKEAFVKTYANKGSIILCFGLLDIIIWVLTIVRKVRVASGTYNRNHL